MSELQQIFTASYLDEVFPPSKTDAFFEALFGDAEDGAYDIRLRFKDATDQELRFEFHLLQRPGMCLACNLTYGLPQVFTRHPILAVGKTATKLSEKIGKAPISWTLQATREISKSLHIIPLTISLA